MNKISIVLALLIFSATLLFGQCEGLEKEAKALKAEFDKVTQQMGNQGIEKAEYDKLLKKRADLWKRVSAKKKEFAKCEEKNKQKYKFLFNEGKELVKKKDYTGALAKFEAAIAEKADFEEAYYRAASMLIQLNKNDHFEEYASKVSDTTKRGKLYSKKATKLKHKNPNLAIKNYKEMAKYYKKDKAYSQIAGIYLTKKNDPANAVKFYQMALKIKKLGKYYNTLGASYISLKDKTDGKKNKDNLHQKAIDAFLKGVNLGSKGYKNYFELCTRLSQAYNEKGKASSGLKYADKALSFKANYGLAHLEKGKALIKMKKFDLAKKSFMEAKKDIITKNQVKFYLDEIEKLKKQ